MVRQAALSKNDDVIDLYEVHLWLNHLSDYHRKVYRLGIRVYLTFDGDEL